MSYISHGTVATIYKKIHAYSWAEFEAEFRRLCGSHCIPTEESQRISKAIYRIERNLGDSMPLNLSEILKELEQYSY